MNWTTEKATETSARGVGMRRVFCLIGLVLCLVVADSLYSVGLFMASAVAVIVLGAVAPGGPERRIKADKQYDSEGTAKVFTLSLGDETVTLDPGKPWVHVDRHKWVTRGLIEEPQSFHVLRDGTVEINGEKLRLDDREGNTKLEHEINKHHTPAVRPHVGSPVLPVTAAHPRAQSTGKVQFKVRLDHLGHLMIEYLGGAERAETSLRGLHTLVQNGLMLKPQSIHLDLLQRNVEIDGVRFECNEAGARQLEETLNSRYAPTLQAERDNAIEIKENPASPTGFDIHFLTVRAGARFDVKGHLTQEQLDILQNPVKCDLLQPGIVLKLSPPHLLVRRKRPDGGEARVPELPDIHYLRANARQLQQFFNHPSIRKTGGATAKETLQATELHPEEILEARIVRHPKDKLVLWLEFVTIQGGRFEWRALTYHNFAELQQSGVFLPHLDITLSLDHRTFSLLNTQTHQEETITIDSQSSDEDLASASRMLSASLKPARPRPAPTEPQTETGLQPVQTIVPEEETGPVTIEPPLAPPRVGSSTPQQAFARPPALTVIASEGERKAGKLKDQRATPAPTGPPRMSDATKASPPIIASSPVNPAPASLAAPGGPQLDHQILALFSETDPFRINTEIFRRLGPRFGIAVQDVRLSLPRVFEDRRFEIISFDEQEIENVLELRSEDFYGFYLSHISEQRIDFVYACRGTHIEWGTDKCVLQPSVTADAMEFRGSALLGLAQTRDNQFVFVVTTSYKQWASPREQQYREAFAHFLTADELAAGADQYTFIWPERRDASTDSSAG